VSQIQYAANTANLADVEHLPNYRFIRGDIVDPDVVRVAMEGCTDVVNFAAETHVDRSLLGDASFIETDVRGVFVLLGWRLMMDEPHIGGEPDDRTGDDQIE
jgi:dTDP-glucose 4,6-dehydratase